MDKRIACLLWMCVFFLPVVSTGCAGAKVQESVTASILPEDNFALSLLDMVFSRYRDYTRAGFEEIVSQDFTPARAEFIDTVESRITGMTVLELTYKIEKSLQTGDQVVTSFNWDKKQAPCAGGTLVQAKGRAEFAFQRTPDGWGLLQVNGDDPF